MKTFQIILLVALFAFAAAKFKQRHRELGSLQRLFGNLDARLTRQIRNAKTAIRNARSRRDRHHTQRRNAHNNLKRATQLRLSAESVYNTRRKDEERKLRKFRVAHKVYLESRRNYQRVHRRETANIKAWDHERSVIEKVRRLLGVNHSKNWRRYVKDRGVRYHARTHQKHKFVGTHFHQGRKRFHGHGHGYRCKNVRVNSRTGSRTVQCPSGYALRGVRRNSVDSLAGIVEFKCCTLKGRGRPSSRRANWVISFDRQGWSNCPAGYAMRGYQKSNGNNIYNLEFALCQKRRNVNKRCYTARNIVGALDRPGWALCRNGYYVTGMYRNTHSGKNAHKLHRIEYFKCCQA